MQEIINIQKNEHYIAMSNYHLQDVRLSIQAKGLLTLLLSRPENWDFSIKDLKQWMNEEESAIWKILNELTAAGYFKSVALYDLKGMKIKTEYFVFEKAQTGKPA